ncbi:hypothetical protein [Novosphingobium pentaromativorans]|uniref:hypothetical protein n=1 Tax=Novosphingobium pentaromativorans TaxID=205844 RepID=UPI00051F868D|nr:hypothetical protein [Novosphingobium pentaromativorans]AIT81640.1 hypothetical protein JI59_18680 [Novosphingobium pentaromativorans US6-1]
MSGKHPETFTVKAWAVNAIKFIDDRGLTREFSDWCGGWPCPVKPEMVSAAPELLNLLAEADRRIAWESVGLGNTFSDRVEAAIAKAEGRA